MLTTRIRRITLIVLALMALLVVTQVAFAQTDDTQARIEVVGPLTALNTSSVIINGLLIDTTGAEISTPLALNAIVKVEGSLLTDGRIQARQINAVTAGLQPGEVEIVGVLQGLTLSEATVNGFRLDISTAEVDSALVIGEPVKAHASLSPDGLWLAREIRAYAPSVDDISSRPALRRGEDFEVVGTLDALNADGTITVAGQTFTLINAEVKDVLVVGALVKVEARLVNGQLVATEVERTRDYLVRDDDDGRDDNDNSSDDNANDNSDDNANDNSDDNDNRSDDNRNDNTSSRSCAVTVPSGWVTYRVQRGDTLSALAMATGSSLTELRAANCLQNARFLRIGQELVVPVQPVNVNRLPAISNANDNYDDDDDNDNSSFNDNNDDNFNDNGSDDNGSDDDGSNDNSDDDDNDSDDNDDD